MVIISRQDIDALVEREAIPGSPVLSVYLDVNQSKPANLNRGFETALDNMLRSIAQQLGNEQERQEFAADAERVHRLVSNYEPRALSLCLFCDDSADFFWWRELQTPLRHDAHWSDTPYVRPLLEALDEYERYGVILTDRAHARLFTVFMGAIEEHHEAFAPAQVRYIKTTGTDHLRSQKQFQRKAEMHARWFLKRVAELMDHLAQVYAFDRLVLAGPVDAASELARLLPKRLRSRLVASIHLSPDADLPQVLAATLPVVREVERAQENQLVDELIAEVHKRGHAVLGLAATLLALQEGRIWRLVYAEGLASQGWQCTACETLFAQMPQACLYCGKPVDPVDDVLEHLAERVLDAGGRVEQARDTAAARLRAVGGVGAFLRF
ncbi:MAG TPA: hypothetical protein VNP04_13410 [Alphaproteobacteria bacterium]|nr:hypothetical protein [Alphaproteobacteria bacterium]